MIMRLLLIQLSVLFVLAVLQFLGEAHFLQWRFWWYDIMLHFLGGLWVGLFLVWILRRVEKNASLIFVVVGVLCIGIAWELFEIVIGSPRETRYYLDTIIDLIMDVVGALLGYWWAHALMTRDTMLSIYDKSKTDH